MSQRIKLPSISELVLDIPGIEVASSSSASTHDSSKLNEQVNPPPASSNTPGPQIPQVVPSSYGFKEPSNLSPTILPELPNQASTRQYYPYWNSGPSPISATKLQPAPPFQPPIFCHQPTYYPPDYYQSQNLYQYLPQYIQQHSIHHYPQYLYQQQLPPPPPPPPPAPSLATTASAAGTTTTTTTAAPTSVPTISQYMVPEVIDRQTKRCHRCGTDETLEWRRGPHGVRTLCNACGLFHAKLVKRKGAALAAKELLSRKVIKGKNGRRIPI